MNTNLYLYKRNNKKNKKDVVFNSFWIYKLINNIKGHTHSAKVEKLVYSTFQYLKHSYKINIPLLVFRFLKTQKLLFKITKVRVAGRIYQLPICFNEFNRYAMASRQSLKQIRLLRANNFTSKFIDLMNSNIIYQQSSSMKNKAEIYKTITSYRGYLHYRWRV